MYQILWMIVFDHCPEALETGMTKILGIIDPIRRGMRDHNIKSTMFSYLPTELTNALLHCFLGILMRCTIVLILHTASKAQNPYSFIYIDSIVDADTAIRWCVCITGIVVSIYIQNRSMCKCVSVLL